MQDVNRVLLIGRLTRDPELKATKGGLSIAELGLAVNERRKVGDEWTEEASFFDVTVFGKQAESVAQFLAKGRQVAVDGKLRQNRWETEDGQKRSRVVVIADTVQFLGSKSDGDSYEPTGFGGDDDIPF